MRLDNLVGGILAGGYAKRLRPLTETLPKPLIEIKEGYTILDRQLLMMKSAGIRSVYLMVGYLRDKIKERYGDFWNGIRIHYIEEDEPMGTVYGIRELLLRTSHDALIMNGDIVCDVNLARMIKWALRLKDAALMFVTKLRSPFGIVETVGDRIASFREKPLLDYYINGGIYVIPNTLKKFFEPYKRGDVERLVFPTLAEEGLLYYYREEGVYWKSIDSLKDLEEVRKEFENRTDYEWGYVRDAGVINGLRMLQVYVMKDFAARMPLRGKIWVSVISGRGYARDARGLEVELAENTGLVELSGVSEITGLENLKLQIYTKEQEQG